MIEIKCKGADTLPIDRILEFQGELKKLSKDNATKLRNSILKHGFIAPFFLWDDQGEWRLLDGHQRLKVLLDMRKEGYDIPLLPVDYIEADDEADAKRKLLHITSQYGEFDIPGLYDFIEGVEVDLSEFRFTDIEIDLSMNPDKPEELEVRPYEMFHVLVSVPIKDSFKVIEQVEKLRHIEGIEIEKSANG